MINLEELNKTWLDIFKYQECKNENETLKYVTAIQHGKAVIKDLTEDDMMALPVENLQMISKINKLFNMISDAQDKSFGPAIAKLNKR